MSETGTRAAFARVDRTQIAQTARIQPNLRSLRSLVLALTLAFFAAPAALAQPATLESVLAPAPEARGDYPAVLASLAETVAADPDSAVARVALVRIASLRGLVGEAREILRAPLERALAAAKRDPENRERILAILTGIYFEAGDGDHAAAAIRARGVIRDWLVIGPFGSSRLGLHDRVFPVEAAQRARTLAIDEPFESRGQMVRWRKAPLDPLDRLVDPDEHIYPAEGAAYALAQLRAPEGTRAIVDVECGGSFKVFWNGWLAVDVNRAAAYHPRSVSFPVTFGSGWQRLLVKDTAARAPFCVRIVAAEGGGPVEGLEVAAGDRLEPLGESSPRAGEPSLRPVAALPDDVWGRIARGVLLDEAGLSAEAIAAIVGALPPGEKPHPALAFILAGAIERADHLPETRRKNDARRYVQVAADAGFAPALERAARFLEEDGKPDEALKKLREVAERFPAFAQARRTAARIARRLGWEAEAIEEARALEKLEPRGVTGKLLLADSYERRGNLAKALELYRAASALDRSQGLEDKVASLLLRRGDAAGAEALAREALARHPGSAARRRVLAEALRAKGDLVGAAALYREAAEIRGGDPGDLARAADALLEAGAREEAERLYRRAVARAPGAYRTERLVGRLAGTRDEFWKEHEIDAAPLIAAAPGHDKYPRASSICVLDHGVTRIHRDGTQVDYVHQVFKLMDQHGVDRYHTLRLPGDVLLIRTIGRDGKVYEPIITDNTDEILMPKLEPGAFIEYKYRRVVSDPPDFQFDSGEFYFRDPQFSEPFCLSRYVVIADEGFPLERIQRNLPGEPRVEMEGGRVTYSWELRDSDWLDQERFMPEKEEILPHVRLIERRGWDDVVEVLRDAALGRTRLTPELRAKAEEVTAGATSDAEKARRLYDFVLSYVKTDGAGNDASQVLVTRSGSRTILLRALLEAAGVPARIAFCGQNPALAPERPWDPPRPELFKTTQMLVIEPRDGRPVWVFEGGRHYPYGLIPTALRGAPALLVSASGGEFRTVPATGDEDGTIETRTSLRLSGKDARASMRTVFREALAYALKDRVAKAQRGQLENFVEGQLASVFLGARLLAFDFPRLEEPGVPFEIAVDAEVRGYVEEREGAPSVKTGLAPLKLGEQFAGETTRDHPMLLRVVQGRRDEATIELGDEYDVESVPRNLLVREKWGSYSLTFAVEDGRVRATRAFRIEPSRIEIAEYPVFLRALREIDAAEQKRIYLRKR